MTQKKSLVASAVGLALSSMMLSASVNAGEIQSIDLKNFGPLAEGTTVRTIYDRDVTGGTADAFTYGEIGWDVLKAKDPGIIVYNNTPIYGNPDNQIIADCVMAPRIPALLVDTNGDGIGDLDKQCNDTFQTHKRYKMSANAIGPIDMVFTVKNADAADGVTVDQDDLRNAYRMIGKLNNHTGARMGGFKVELGFGLGSGFVTSQAADGLKISLHEEGADSTTDYGPNDMAEFPGGLFYGPADEKHGWGFFSSTRAGFEVDTAAITGAGEDSFGSTTAKLSANYKDVFGEWLPIDKVPPGWFLDGDGNPATDAEVVAWWDGVSWLTYNVDPATGARTEVVVSSATVASYINTPMTVYSDDGDSTTVTGGTLYATWNAADGVYDLALGGGTMTNDEMTIAIGATGSTLERRSGYFSGPIEDLANLNLNYFIDVADITAVAPMNSDGDYTFTLRITPLAATDNSVPLWVTNPPPADYTTPVTPVTTSSGGGGCAIGGNGRFDPTLPALLVAGLGFFGWRRFKAGK